MTAAYSYVRRHYGVDPVVGQVVRHIETGEDGTVARPGRSHGHYVRVRFPGRPRLAYAHPAALDYDPSPRIALEHLSPAIVAYFGTQRVHIWSGEHRAWWRPDGAGYTVHHARAGVYELADAYDATSHVGPEKRIQFERAGA